MVTVPAETTMADDRASNTSHQLAIKKLLPSYELVSVCNGEFVAFVIAWNLIMEYMVIVALISKALIIFFGELFFDSVGYFTQIIPMSWNFSQHFDVIALFVPIIIGGKRNMSYKIVSIRIFYAFISRWTEVPLLLILGRNAILNVLSIGLSLLIVAIFLILSIFNGKYEQSKTEKKIKKKLEKKRRIRQNN